jgi:MoaA/NifB/PqqE/SkfB family radical SAM enzyme
LKKDDTSNAPSETFCILPWVQLYTEPDGRLRPCPITVRDDHDGGDQAVGLYEISGPEGIERVWNAPFMKSMRLDMLKGERPAACRFCFRDEDLGVQHYRRDFNKEYSDYIDQAVASTSEDGSSPVGLIKKLDLYLGNQCNLRCRMCSPHASKALIPEWAVIHKTGESDSRLQRLQSLDWYVGEDFNRTVEELLPHVNRIHFAGGEPMLIPQMFETLERLINLGYAKDITLSYNSNLTVLPKPLFDLWPHFKGVRLTASIDGIGEVNSFIRYPAHWPAIESNIRRLDTDFDRIPLSSLSWNTTVQIYNVFRLDELIEYAATSFTHLSQPNLSILNQPEYLNIQILPPEMKQQAAARLRDFTARFADRWPARWHGRQVEELLAAIKGIIDYMQSADRSDLLPEFRRWCGAQDQFRGQNASDILPELAPLFDASR